MISFKQIRQALDRTNQFGKNFKSDFIDIFNSNRRFEKGYPNEAKTITLLFARLRTNF